MSSLVTQCGLGGKDLREVRDRTSSLPSSQAGQCEVWRMVASVKFTHGCSCFIYLPIFLGNVRAELYSHHMVHMGIYDDGPYEVGDERKLEAKLVPVPAHSYLGRILV